MLGKPSFALIIKKKIALAPGSHWLPAPTGSQLPVWWRGLFHTTTEKKIFFWKKNLVQFTILDLVQFTILDLVQFTILDLAQFTILDLAQFPILDLEQFTIVDLVKFHLCVTTLTHFSIFPFSIFPLSQA